jgi:hypothetical protein
MNININASLLNLKARFLELFAVAAAILLFLIALQIVGCATSHNKQGVKPLAKVKSIEERWGIQIIGIRQTAAGYMLDFRYRVTDPEKAAPLFVRKTKPYLIDQASGAKFAVPNPPKTGPLRTSDPPQANRIYFIFFGNPGKYIKPGNKVTVVIGDFRVENLVVE